LKVEGIPRAQAHVLAHPGWRLKTSKTMGFELNL
jgi:hypothetical protein